MSELDELKKLIDRGAILNAGDEPWNDAKTLAAQARTGIVQMMDSDGDGNIVTIEKGRLISIVNARSGAIYSQGGGNIDRETLNGFLRDNAEFYKAFEALDVIAPVKNTDGKKIDLLIDR